MVGNLNPDLGREVSFWSKILYILAVTGLATIGEVCGPLIATQWYCMMNRTSSNGFRNQRSHSHGYRGLESQLGAWGARRTCPNPSKTASPPLRQLATAEGRLVGGRVLPWPGNHSPGAFQRFPTLCNGFRFDFTEV